MQSKSYAALDPEKLSSLDPNSSYARIRELVGSGKRVLDIGCGPGNLAAVLRAAGNTVVGIDKDQGALVSAARFCERTFAADLDAAEVDRVVGDDRFDIVVFADVLEHLRDPARLLGSSRSVLREAGCAIISVPNVAHGAVRLALLRGRFDYQQLGILDDTHLRFYTRESVMRLLCESGFTAVRVDRTTAPVFERSDLVPFVRREDYDPGVVAEMLRDEDAETLQFVIRAAPVDEAQVVAVLTAEITSLQQALRTLRAQLAQAHDSAATQPNAAAAAERLAEVEQHEHRLARELAELAARDAELTAAAERARAELDAVYAQVAERDAALAASAAALDELRARHDEVAGALPPLREELLRIQQFANQLEGERDAALARAAAADDDSARAKASAAEANSAVAHMNAAVAEGHENLRTARALIAEIERELAGAREEIAALLRARGALEADVAAAQADRDEVAAWADALDAALAAVEGTERDARDRIAALQAALSEVAPERRALRRRAADLANLLVVERTTREHVEESADRILAVARDREARLAESGRQRLLARSAAVELELRLAMSTVRSAPAVAVPPPTSLPPAHVLRAETVGRRTLTVLPPPAGRRGRVRAALRRLRRLLPLALLLAVSGASCAAQPPVIDDAGPAFVRIGDDPSVYFLPARSSAYCVVTEPEQMKRFGGFEHVKQYEAGARFPQARHLDGLCRYPDGEYVVGGTTYVLRGGAICRGNAPPRNAIVVTEAARLSASRRDIGRCRSTG